MKVQEVLRKLKRVFVKRQYKDILFRFVFREKAELLKLYNAINQTDYTNPEDLIITTMEDVIYMGMKNDLSFLLANELNLYEHQSTVNSNMPLRGLLYFAKLYEGYIEANELNRYQNKRIPLPFPRFIVFYNGEDAMPEEMTLRLSEAFEEKGEEPAVECIARFININYGCNKALMEKCKRLGEYSSFIQCVRKYIELGYGQKQAIMKAVDECIDKGILKDVLVKHRAEVFDMFLTKFDKKMYEEAIRIDAREKGLSEGRAVGLEEGRAKGLEEGRAKGLEEGRAKGLKEGRAEGRAEGINALAKEHAKRLKDKGISYETAKEIVTEVDEDTLKDIYAR